MSYPSRRMPFSFEGNSEESMSIFLISKGNGEDGTKSKMVPKGDMQMVTKCNHGEEKTYKLVRRVK